MARRNVVVIGPDRFGSQMARNGNRVQGIDDDEQLVAAVTGRLTEAVLTDARNEAALRETGTGSSDAAVIAIGSGRAPALLHEPSGAQPAGDGRKAFETAAPAQPAGAGVHEPRRDQVIALVRCTRRLNGMRSSSAPATGLLTSAFALIYGHGVEQPGHTRPACSTGRRSAVVGLVQLATPQRAGFNTTDQAAMHGFTMLLTMTLMASAAAPRRRAASR